MFNRNEPRDENGQWTHLAGLMHTAGGFTSLNGVEATKGYAVAVPTTHGKDWKTLPHGTTTAKDIEDFARKHAKELSVPGRAIGGWSNDNPEYGDVRDALDIVHIYDTDTEAAQAAFPEQDAFYDLAGKREVQAKEVFDRLRTAQADDPEYQKREAARQARDKVESARLNKAYVATINKHPIRAGMFGVNINGKAVRKALTDMSIQTPVFNGEYDLSLKDGKVAFWKQILPRKQIHYTAKDGTRQVLDFNDPYLTDLATNKAVDKVGFLLADVDNRHTMDPERWRGEVAEWKIRDDQPNPDHNGLYGKIVFPNMEAAQAVLNNPDLGVSARIREGIPKSDGSTVSRGIIHVLGTLDPQVSGMSGWTSADLSTETDTLLDLTAETYENGQTMSDDQTRSVTDYTEDEIAQMDAETLNAFLAAAEAEFAGILDEVEQEMLAETETEDEREPEMASLSNEAQSQIDLANARSSKALTELAQAKWDRTRDAYMNAGVPVDLLDLAEPIFNRQSDFVVDLSNEGTEGQVNVGDIVAKLLDAAKGTIDLSAEVGHGGTFRSGDGEDPDKALLDIWNAQQG